MARDQGVKAPAAGDKSRSTRTPATKPAATSAVASTAPARRKTTPSQFMQEVRVEARKITWTPWKETWITSVMVFLMVALTAIFFSLVDGGFSFLMQQILKLAS